MSRSGHACASEEPWWSPVKMAGLDPLQAAVSGGPGARALSNSSQVVTWSLGFSSVPDGVIRKLVEDATHCPHQIEG